MRGKQSDLSLWTGITITLSSNYPRRQAAVCASPHWLLILSRDAQTSLGACNTVCLGCGNHRVHFLLLLSLIGFLLLFPTAVCLISSFILLPLNPSSIRLQITGAQEDRNEAVEEENRVKGRQLAYNGRSQGCIVFGAAHKSSKEPTNWLTCALKLKKKIINEINKKGGKSRLS